MLEIFVVVMHGGGEPKIDFLLDMELVGTSFPSSGRSVLCRLWIIHQREIRGSVGIASLSATSCRVCYSDCLWIQPELPSSTYTIFDTVTVAVPAGP